jgi:hypothetical protein
MWDKDYREMPRSIIPRDVIFYNRTGSHVQQNHYMSHSYFRGGLGKLLGKSSEYFFKPLNTRVKPLYTCTNRLKLVFLIMVSLMVPYLLTK